MGKKIIFYMETLSYYTIDLTLVCIYYVPGTILGTGDSMKKEIHEGNKTYTAYIPMGKMKMKKN